MTEDKFDAEKWLRKEAITTDNPITNHLILCAEELAEAKAKIAQLERMLRPMFDYKYKADDLLDEKDNKIAELEAINGLQVQHIGSLNEQLEAAEAIGRKLYEAAKAVIDSESRGHPMIKEEWEPLYWGLHEAIITYEKERK